MKRVTIQEAEAGFTDLIAEAEKGSEVIITRDGKPVAKLVQVGEGKIADKLTPEQVAERRKAIAELREIANRIKINASQEEIKSWIEEGRH
jgi:prevent-host-death family protein